MYPYIHLGSLQIPVYAVCIAVGILAAVVVFIKICQRDKIENAIINFYINILLVAIAAGFGSAILFQSIYHLVETGRFELDGLTFLGGLIGGVAVFFVLHFIFAKEQHKAVFMRICCNTLVCVALAHCFGRVGCFFGGCCFGKVTDGPFGILFAGQTQKRLPTQLFEAVFLLALFFAMLFTRKYAFCTYPIAYGVWRFIIEFWRDDPRGHFVPGLTPSQFQSLLLIAVGLALLGLYLYRRYRAKSAKA